MRIPIPGDYSLVVKQEFTLHYNIGSLNRSYCKILRVGEYLWHMGQEEGRTYLFDMDGETGSITAPEYRNLHHNNRLNLTTTWLSVEAARDKLNLCLRGDGTLDGDALDRLR